MDRDRREQRAGEPARHALAPRPVEGDEDALDTAFYLDDVKAVAKVAVDIDLWVMLAISILIWPIMRTGFSINRLEGCFLLLIYCGYTIYLFVRSAPGA